MQKLETVKVVVRCRPLNEKEKQENRQIAISADPKTASIIGYNPKKNNEKKEFTFDFTYSQDSSQETIFNETALPILDALMKGYNGTIFAYGQTGTGKTFTMEGGNNELKGIIPRTIDWIFDYIHKNSSTQFLVQVSFIEIYNEEVKDLLSKENQKLNIREKNGIFYVEGAKIYKVESPKEMQKLMNKGKENRKTGETLMNAGSSRSHSIFQIRVENSEEIDGEVKYKIGKLNLVDLAGSERPEKTGATGARLKEGININLSLTTLGNVISALVTKEAGGFIPYRESKLTMLLSDSLGGNTKTVMIANIGPADYNYDESLVTLWYAARAKKIKNKPKINEDPKDALLRSYQEEIEQIKKQLEQLNKGNVPLRQIKDKDGKIIQVEDEAAVKKLDEQLEKEKEEFKRKKEEEIKVIKEQKDMEEKEKDRLLKIIEKEKDDFKKNKEEAKNLFNKYKEMQSKVLNSKETHMKVKKQEEEISRTKEELRAIKMEEERLKRDLEEKSKTKLEFAKKYEDVQSKIDDINEKIQMIRDEIDNKKNENKENIEKIQNDIIELSEINKELTRENLKKEFIIKNFIPENEKVRISECLEFNEREGIYFVNKKKAIKKIYLCNEEILSKMKNNQNVEGGFMKYDFDKGDCDSMVNLNFELPDKLVSDFLGEPNEHFNKEVENILKDDDSDLLYYDKDLNLFDSNIIPMSETGLKDLLKAASQQQPVIKKKK